MTLAYDEFELQECAFSEFCLSHNILIVPDSFPIQINEQLGSPISTRVCRYLGSDCIEL